MCLADSAIQKISLNGGLREEIARQGIQFNFYNRFDFGLGYNREGDPTDSALGKLNSGRIHCLLGLHASV
jgi:hypothetical protein